MPSARGVQSTPPVIVWLIGENRLSETYMGSSLRRAIERFKAPTFRFTGREVYFSELLASTLERRVGCVVLPRIPRRRLEQGIHDLINNDWIADLDSSKEYLSETPSAYT